MKRVVRFSAAVVAVSLLVACASKPMMLTEEAQPFGGPSAVAFSKDLWQALAKARLVGGVSAYQTKAYKGQHPHGAVLQNVDSTVTVKRNITDSGVTGPVIVKSNFGGPGVSIDAVTNNPSQYLAAVTVMFKYPGYDPDNNDWFWAKYLPDGSLDKNPKGMLLAGRVVKGNDKAGCIACHRAAPGGDLVFTHNRFAN